jgi:hypothetical protein
VKIKDPAAPATDAQINAIVKMAAKAGVATPAVAGLTKGEASDGAGGADDGADRG